NYWDGDSLNVTEADIVEGEKIETLILSVGSGLKFEKIWFDIAYQFGSSEFDQLTTINVLGEDTEINDPLKFKYSRLYFSVGMLF
ncbi:MAG: hypothetical protein GY839_20155, partial [candidate division Zixibacteria bacterium]|nr:hypothetical protein [candidate division Zixibacteria bacterium]